MTEKIFEEIMTEIFTNLARNIIYRFMKNLRGKSQRNAHQHISDIISKFPKTKEKKRKKKRKNTWNLPEKYDILPVEEM